MGKSIHLNFPDGETAYKETTYDCKMLLCKKDHSNPTTGWEKSCVDNHVESLCKVAMFAFERKKLIFLQKAIR
jgi:hypothetical protein